MDRQTKKDKKNDERDRKKRRAEANVLKKSLTRCDILPSREETLEGKGKKLLKIKECDEIRLFTV